MRRNRIYLLATLLAASALAAAHAVIPAAARADELYHIWGLSTLGETCSGRCGGNYICCQIVIVQPPPVP